MENISDEYWVDVKGYDGQYKVSSLGTVVSLKWGREKILKGAIRDDGYLHVTLYKDKKTVQILVHRLMCMTFLSNNGGKPYVNHINGNKSDNRIDNLEWCTGKENYDHALSIGLVTKGKNIKAKPILQISLTGVTLKRWDNMFQIKKALGYNNLMVIPCCNGIRDSAYGFKWQFYKK